MNRQKTYIILAILVAAGFFLQFATLPMIKASKATGLNLAERKAYLKDRQEIIKRITELENEKAQWNDEVEKLDLAIPTESGLADVVFQLQNFAMDSGLIMKDVGHNEQPSSDSSGGMTLSINSSLVGSYTSLKSFFGKLENNLRITDVERIDFGLEATGEEDSSGSTAKDSGSKGEQLFNATFGAKLYYFPTEKVSIK